MIITIIILITNTILLLVEPDGNIRNQFINNQKRSRTPAFIETESSTLYNIFN